MSLRNQVKSGMLWVSAAAMVGRVLSFVTTLILARLLAPEHFGLIALAHLVIESLQFFQELGFGSALIYRQKDVDKAANATFWIVISSSLLIFGLLVLSAPLVAGFFRAPDLAPVLQVLSLTMVIGSFGRVPYVLLSKELNFKRKVLPELTGTVIGNVTAIVLAWQGYGVWSIVYGQILEASLRTLLVWFLVPWRPNLSFDAAVAREMFGYGKHIVGSQALIFGITHIDDAFVGRIAGTAALGHYGIAYKLSNMPATQITSLINQVMFPAFSKIQGDIIRMRNAYYRVVRYVGLLSVPLALGMITFADDFVRLILKDAWAPAIVPLQLLALYGLIRSIAANMGNIFRAGGKPEWLMYIALWRLGTMAALLYPVTVYWGIVGVSALSALVAVVDFYISAVLVKRIIHSDLMDYVSVLGPIFILSLASAASGKGVQHVALWSGLEPLLAMIVGAGMMVLTYAALIYWRDMEVRGALQSLWARRVVTPHA